MDKASLKKLRKSQLIKLLMKQDNNTPISQKRPVPAPRKSVKEMVKRYEENIILPPMQFRDNYKPIPKQRTVKRKPVPTPRTVIKQIDKALNGFVKSYEIDLRNDKDPLIQMQNTRKGVERQLSILLNEMKGLKYVETLKVTFEKISSDVIIEKSAYFNSASQTIINQVGISESLKISSENIINKIAQWISEGSGWTVKEINDHYLNITKYEPMKGSSYMKLPKELQNSAKGLINMKNKDNECFRWCHIRHINPQEKYPQRIKKVDKQYIEKLNYSGIEFPVCIKH